jgi:hypothetical protein
MKINREISGSIRSEVLNIFVIAITHLVTILTHLPLTCITAPGYGQVHHNLNHNLAQTC